MPGIFFMVSKERGKGMNWDKRELNLYGKLREKWRKLEFSKLVRFKSGGFPGKNLDRGLGTHQNPLGQDLKHP